MIMKLHKAIIVPAGDKAVLMYSAFANVKMLQFICSELEPSIFRMAIADICQKAKTAVVLEVCPWPMEHKLHPHIDIGKAH
jgi:hypothetical protein